MTVDYKLFLDDDEKGVDVIDAKFLPRVGDTLDALLLNRGNCFDYKIHKVVQRLTERRKGESIVFQPGVHLVYAKKSENKEIKE